MGDAERFQKEYLEQLPHEDAGREEIPRTGPVYPAPGDAKVDGEGNPLYQASPQPRQTELPEAKFREPSGGPVPPTLGMRRVRASFNPSGNPNIDALKTVTAHLIDLVEHLKELGHDPRDCALAQTAYEEGCMWAVKAATDKS